MLFCDRGLTTQDLVAKEETPRLQNFDEFIPHNLLGKAITCDYINGAELQPMMRSWS